MDLWGGFADRQRTRPWNADTLTLVQFAWRCLANSDLPTLMALVAVSFGRWAPPGMRGSGLPTSYLPDTSFEVDSPASGEAGQG